VGIETRLAATLKARLVGNARQLMFFDAGDVVILVYCWPLNTDPVRPSKFSKTIKVVVPFDLLTALEGQSPDRLDQSLENIGQWFEARLAAFNPDHSIPLYTSPPVERWDLAASVAGVGEPQ
jgi:hypothetical protein